MQGRRVFSRQPVVEIEKQEHNVSKLRELLRLEETKLQALRHKRGQQSTSAVNSKATEIQKGGVIHAVQGIGNVQACGGTGKAGEEALIQANGGQQPAAPGISTRLQQLVDSISTDQLSTKKAAITSQSSRHLMVTTNSLINHMQADMGGAQQVGKPCAKSSSPPEVITIPDTPSPSSPPALIHNHTGLPSAIQVPTISSAHHKHSRSESPKPDEETIMKAVESSKKYREFIMKQAAVKRSFQKQIDKRMSTTPYPKTFRQVWPIIPVHDSSFVKNLGLEMVTMYFDPNWKTVHSKPPPATKVKPVCNQCGCDFASAWQIRKNNSKQVLLCESCDFTNLKLLQRTKLASQLKDLVEEIRKEETRFLNECKDAKKQVVEMERTAILNSHKVFGKTSAVQPSVITQQLTRESHPLYSSIQSSNHAFARGGIPEAAQQLPGKAIRVKPGLVQLPVSSEMTHAVIPSILSSHLSKPSVHVPSFVSKNMSTNIPDVSRKRRSPEVDTSAPVRKVSKTLPQLDNTLDHITRQLLRKQVDEKCKKRWKLDHVHSLAKPQLPLNQKQLHGQSNSRGIAVAGKPTPSVNHHPPVRTPSVPSIDIAAPPSPPTMLKGSPAVPSEGSSSGGESLGSDCRRSRRKGRPRQNRIQSGSSNME